MEINLGGYKVQRHQILGAALLLFGLILGLYLVQQQVLLRSRAAVDVSTAFDIKDSSGPLSCSGETCQTKSLEVQIKVKDLEALIE